MWRFICLVAAVVLAIIFGFSLFDAHDSAHFHSLHIIVGLIALAFLIEPWDRPWRRAP